MALRAAVRSALWQSAKRPATQVTVARAAGAAVAQNAKAFSTNSLFSEASFPVKEDPAMWLQKYARMDPADMWKVGSFPVQKDAAATEEPRGLSCSQDLWDTQGMLSALSDDLPLSGGARGVDELLREMDMAHGYFADSVLKKRRKKMNKHKHRKRRKAVRMRTKKN
ncbi:TPA: hypothetical protein N0F65_001113 [Lagenidium giganteum]|uniref:Small ribosomal subunit protein mS38 n=1 Tax=Lagenidium giganteum TaxID=4803 RepID=A0AAV2YP19_9STRA|nr:TPA: hypothetical protein N0F65_001113 [Lagenidium giganteum]